jgi:hypothetical protein
MDIVFIKGALDVALLQDLSTGGYVPSGAGYILMVKK